MIERKLETSRGDVYYWLNKKPNKQKQCLVFSHGLTADHGLFRYQVEALSDDYQLLLWDIPLHGKSRPYDDFSYKNCVEDLRNILKREELENIILIGQSAGGYINQSFLKTYAGMVRGFVGIGTTPFGEKYYSKSELFWIKYFVPIAKLYPFSYYCEAGSKAVAKTKEGQKYMYETLHALGKEGILTAAGAIYGDFLKETIPLDFECPVLLCHGEFDKTGLVKKYNNQWADSLGISVEIIEGSAHNANYDNPEAFNTLLKRFLGSLC